MTTKALQGHTPGPWTHKATAGDHDFAVYPEATGRDVALVRDFNEANARLIAAAPEMLDVLQRISRAGMVGLTNALARDLATAIARATEGK